MPLLVLVPSGDRPVILAEVRLQPPPASHCAHPALPPSSWFPWERLPTCSRPPELNPPPPAVCTPAWWPRVPLSLEFLPWLAPAHPSPPIACSLRQVLGRASARCVSSAWFLTHISSSGASHTPGISIPGGLFRRSPGPHPGVSDRAGLCGAQESAFATNCPVMLRLWSGDHAATTV